MPVGATLSVHACASFDGAPTESEAPTDGAVEDVRAEPVGDARARPPDLLFEPPLPETTAGREIGVMGGKVYWRFDKDKRSGIASGPVTGEGVGSVVYFEDEQTVTRLYVGRHVVFQHSPGAVVVAINRLAPDGPSVEVVRSGGPRCGSFATVDTTVYCRTETPNEVPTYLYSAPITGGEWKLEYRLPVAYEQPIGGDLGLDGQHLYFAEDPGAPDAAIIERASLPDGGSTEPSITKLFFGQTAPHDLVVGEAELFWLDDQGAKVAKKAGGEPRAVLGGRAIAVDPTSPTTLWIAVEGPPPSREWSIVKASAVNETTAPLRRGLAPIGGIAVDESNVFWTASDGRVYRAAKN